MRCADFFLLVVYTRRVRTTGNSDVDAPLNSFLTRHRSNTLPKYLSLESECSANRERINISTALVMYISAEYLHATEGIIFRQCICNARRSRIYHL